MEAPMGLQGIQGNPGLRGPMGFQGLTGPTGFLGSTGHTGVIGNQGPTGPSGPLGSKGAIVKIGSEYRALWCMEAPDVWFMDRIKMIFPKDHWAIDNTGIISQDRTIDPMFISSCDPDTLEVMSTSSSEPVMIGATIHGDKLTVNVSEPFAGSIMVWIAGIRKGAGTGYRFQLFPEKVAERNMLFWTGLLKNNR